MTNNESEAPEHGLEIVPPRGLTRAERHAVAVKTKLKGLVEDAGETIDASRADNTKRVYASNWGVFVTWCREHNLRHLPATEHTLIVFLQDRFNAGRSLNILRGYVNPVRFHHTEAKHNDPTTAKTMKRLFEGFRRKAPLTVNQKDPLTLDDLRRMHPEGDDAMALRDWCLMTLGIAGGFRRSELVALDLSDLTIDKQGLRVTVRKSKTDQAGVGRVIGIAWSRDTTLCAVRSLQAWAQALKDTFGSGMGGPLFRPINRHGKIRFRRLTGQSVNLIVRKHAKRAGILERIDIGAHSHRAGFATEAGMQGLDIKQIARQGRWASLEQVYRYFRPTAVFNDGAQIL